jgi:hypothetical protein
MAWASADKVAEPDSTAGSSFAIITSEWRATSAEPNACG